MSRKGQQPYQMDEEIKQLVIQLGTKLTDRDQIDMLSEIYPLEDARFAKLLMIDEMLGLGSISLWVRTILSLRVSLKRKGRREIIQVLKNLFLPAQLQRDLNTLNVPVPFSQKVRSAFRGQPDELE